MKQTSVIYGTDIDRTLIFSHRFLNEHNCKGETVVVETKDNKIISYMSKRAYDKLKEINENPKIHFIPVTTRSIEEYNRIDLGITPEYAVLACGGIILHDGKPIEEYSKYVKSYLDPLELATLSIDLDEFSSLVKSPRLVDNCYLFARTSNEELFDAEVGDLIDKYPKWQFIRQKNKCYIIPNHISKQVALRWLWNKLDEPYIIASGDSLLDVPMLSLANKAYIPSHSSLLEDGVVQQGNIVCGDIESPYQTMIYVEGIARNCK